MQMNFENENEILYKVSVFVKPSVFRIQKFSDSENISESTSEQSKCPSRDLPFTYRRFPPLELSTTHF